MSQLVHETPKSQAQLRGKCRAHCSTYPLGFSPSHVTEGALARAGERSPHVSQTEGKKSCQIGL